MLCFSLLRFTPPLPTHTIFYKSEHKTLSHTLNFSPTPFLHNFRSKRFTGYDRDSSLAISCSNSSVSSVSVEDDFDVELGRLLALLPEEMRRRVSEHTELHQLIEVVMDLGRKPLARFPSGDFVLSDFPITLEDLQHAISQVGDFAIDNRAGISKTLHRISAIRNRKSAIIGLTCRVGRAISGSAGLLRDLVQDGASLLLIGPPGVGKTTIIREIARMLANDHKKRVMIVDTSNEIGGDGDIPHPGIGNARRMQVPHVDIQHKVLIEAVENHMPQVIVIDEIGTKLEAMAASTIAQRGIQLVATAHGITIENLTMNPSLEMLVGGIQSVTLGDEEASRRRVQKTVLERKGPPTFICAVEIISKSELRIHRSLETTVDAILAGRSPYYEVRKIKSDRVEESLQKDSLINDSYGKKNEMIIEDVPKLNKERVGTNELISELKPSNTGEYPYEDEAPLHLYIYGIVEESVIRGIKQLDLDTSIKITDNIIEADALLALQSRLKKDIKIQSAAKSHNIPIYMTKTSSLVQITRALRALVNDQEYEAKDLEDTSNFSEKIDALEEARIAIEQIVIPKGETVELLPRSTHIMSLQIELIRKYKLNLEKIGTGSEVRIRILPFQTKIDADKSMNYDDDDDGMIEDEEIDEYANINGDTNGSLHRVESLPLLPD